MKPRTPYFGLMAEFASVDALRKATRQARRAGYREMDAYAPFAVEGLATDLGLRRTRIPFVVLIGAIVGAGVGFGMQYYTMAVDYPFDVGGRPLNSWLVFVPIAFEVTILIAALSAVLGMLFLNGLPRLHHPVFNVERFARASQDGFFLCIEAADPKYDPERTRQFFVEQQASAIMEVPH